MPTAKEEFLQQIKNNFLQDHKVLQMIDTINSNISFAIERHHENKDLLSELEEFPAKNLTEYNKFCDRFLRKKLGDVIGVDSVFIYTHPAEYKTDLEKDFALTLDENMLGEIAEMSQKLLKLNLEPHLQRHSWAAKVKR